MKTKVQVVFPATPPERPSWPYIGYDVQKRSREITAFLRERLPDFDFSPLVLYNAQEAERAAAESQGAFDGYLVYMTAMWNGVAETYARQAHPVVIADELYAGSGGFLRASALIHQEKLPVVEVASSDPQDLIEAIRLFGVMKKMRESKIIVVSDAPELPLATPTKELFGTELVPMRSAELKSYYDKADEEEARFWQRKWMEEALKVVEPDAEEILRSARMYLALKTALQDAKAEAITVDCLGLYYGGKLPAYPCLGFFQLNNEGLTGVCEADVESTITQLLIRYLAGRPGYVSDPVIDTASNQIIYAHCVATNRVFGPEGLHNPYIIRSHAEDRQGAAIQSLLPLGKTVTTAKVSIRHKAFAIHTAKAVANVEEDKACRTKLAAQADVAKLLRNYQFDIFSWHRVTCYGDWRKQLLNLATLYGLQIFEEDRG